MTPRDLIRNTSELFRLAGIPDPEYDASVLLSYIYGKPSLSLRLDNDTILDEKTVLDYNALAGRRIRREPLQYILREAPFFGHDFYVDRHVLIPRPETELLCEWASEVLSCEKQPQVLDLCCGSGCLGISLKLRKPSAAVTCSDISADALDVAKLNAFRLNADVSFLQSDLFADVPDGLFNLIVSNPPYIPSSQCGTLQQEVMMEPRLALDGGSDGLYFYRIICREAIHRLLSGGSLMMELGDGLSSEVLLMMEKAGFSSIEIRNDYQQIPRMIRGIFM